jgi:hypothetical protein
MYQHHQGLWASAITFWAFLLREVDANAQAHNASSLLSIGYGRSKNEA